MANILTFPISLILNGSSGTDFGSAIDLGGAEVTGVLLPANGGTGVANNAAATFTRSGNHALTITTSGTANLNIGTGGTLGTSAYTATATPTTLGLVIGTNVQAYDADLTTWAGVTPGANVATFLATPSLANLNAAVSDADVAQLGANTFTADQTYAENVAIVLDAALSADGKYTGIVEDGTAGAALAFGELCYFQTADSRWEKSQAAAAQIATANLRLGMCVLAAAGDASATKMLLIGKIRADSLFPTFTIGAPVYMSAATAGVVTSTAPTGTTDFTVRKIGWGVTGDELYFNPSNDFITLA